MSDNADKSGTPGPERRRRPDVRAVFEDAVALMLPFYQTADRVPLEYWAAHELREAYPDLDMQGFQILMAAVSRVCRERAAMRGGERAAGTQSGHAANPAK